jgi:iron complex transport system substrate-binding protein
VKKEKMETKNKMIAIVEIAVVLCSIFLVAIPAIAADQTTQKISATGVTTTSEDDYILGVYGNANEDDTIDMGDVVYTKLAIFGKKPKTKLCDAKYDGRINVLDVIQTKLIILGKEKELTLTDSMEKIITVKKPINRIVVTWRGMLEMLRLIRVEKERIVGVESLILSSGGVYGVNYKIFFPEYQDKANIGIVWTPDCEAILNLHPDAVFLFPRSRLDDVSDKLESAGITVIRIYGADDPDELRKFGYIIDKEDEAEEFIDWHASIMNSIKERVEKIPEEDKPKVYFEYTTKKYNTCTESCARIYSSGGKNIFPDVQGYVIPVNPEAVVARNPDFIVQGSGCGGYELDAGDPSKFEEKRDEIMSRYELQIVTAVREKQVYVLSGYLMYGGPCAGCRGFLGTVYMAKWFHPELFEDLDPQAIHQEYLERFQGLDIDLDEKGVFVYPEPS